MLKRNVYCLFTQIRNLDIDLFQSFTMSNDMEAAAALLSETFWAKHNETVDEIVKDFLATAWKR